MDPVLLISIFFAIGIFCVFLGIDLIITGRQVGLRSRIDGYASLPSATASEGPDAPTTTERLARRMPRNWQQQIAADLARAALPITVSEYLLINAATTFVGFLAGFVILGGNPLLTLLSTSLGFFSLRWYVSYAQSNRLLVFNTQLDSTLLLLANGLRAGYGFLQALETVAKEISPPMSTELSRVTREVALGLPLESALDNLVQRNPSLDLEMVVTAINVNHEVGGNLAEILDRVSETIRERIRLIGEIRALTSQQRFSAVVLTFLPVAVILILYVINGDYVSVLWTNTCGLEMLGVSAFLIIVAYVVIRRIMTIKF